ncbi:MAG TPA: VOC family protein [Pseudonocardia sp.]|jgi:catechol 2,3-dioxygenase-like lactoylglutathione lyase family enzyme|nr:VOC family protein [Pseudonocardia sp.]
MGFRTGHVGINVTNLARSQAFYESVFGLTELGGSQEDGKKFALLGNPDVDSDEFLERLAITLWEQSDGRRSHSTLGLHHLAFHVPSLEDVEQVRGQLSEMGVDLLGDDEVGPHNENSPSCGIFFQDPDGTRLEVCAPAGVTSSNAVCAAVVACVCY